MPGLAGAEHGNHSGCKVGLTRGFIAQDGDSALAGSPFLRTEEDGSLRTVLVQAVVKIRANIWRAAAGPASRGGRRPIRFCDAGGEPGI